VKIYIATYGCTYGHIAVLFVEMTPSPGKGAVYILSLLQLSSSRNHKPNKHPTILLICGSNASDQDLVFFFLVK
jgi:hypothetical protein